MLNGQRLNVQSANYADLILSKNMSHVYKKPCPGAQAIALMIPPTIKSYTSVRVMIEFLVWGRMRIKIRLTVGLLLEQYAVKVQRSLAPLSRFRASHILTAHEQECYRFQSYAKIYKRNLHCVNHIPGIHDNGPRDHEL